MGESTTYAGDLSTVREKVVFPLSASGGLGTLESIIVIVKPRVRACHALPRRHRITKREHSTQRKSSPRVLTPVIDLLLQFYFLGQHKNSFKSTNVDVNGLVPIDIYGSWFLQRPLLSWACTCAQGAVARTLPPTIHACVPAPAVMLTRASKCA